MASDLPLNRKQKILELLEEKKVLSTNELIEKLGRSRATIIRDLSRLEKEGYIDKGYGTVLFKKKFNIPVYSVEESLESQIEEKDLVAQKALSLININDTIALSNGVTTKLLAEKILNSNIPVQLITNSLFIINLYASNQKRNITVMGGDFSPEIYGFQGEVAKNIMRMLRCDTCFVSVHGIDPVEGLTVRSSQLAELDYEILSRSKKVVIMADYSKFGRTSLYKIDFDLKRVNVIVTDDKTDKNYLEIFRGMGIECY